MNVDRNQNKRQQRRPTITNLHDGKMATIWNIFACQNCIRSEIHSQQIQRTAAGKSFLDADEETDVAF